MDSFVPDDFVSLCLQAVEVLRKENTNNILYLLAQALLSDKPESQLRVTSAAFKLINLILLAAAGQDSSVVHQRSTEFLSQTEIIVWNNELCLSRLNDVFFPTKRFHYELDKDEHVVLKETKIKEEVDSSSLGESVTPVPSEQIIEVDNMIEPVITETKVDNVVTDIVLPDVKSDNSVQPRVIHVIPVNNDIISESADFKTGDSQNIMDDIRNFYINELAHEDDTNESSESEVDCMSDRDIGNTSPNVSEYEDIVGDISELNEGPNDLRVTEHAYSIADNTSCRRSVILRKQSDDSKGTVESDQKTGPVIDASPEQAQSTLEPKQTKTGTKASTTIQQSGIFQRKLRPKRTRSKCPEIQCWKCEEVLSDAKSFTVHMQKEHKSLLSGGTLETCSAKHTGEHIEEECTHTAAKHILTAMDNSSLANVARKQAHQFHNGPEREQTNTCMKCKPNVEMHDFESFIEHMQEVHNFQHDVGKASVQEHVGSKMVQINKNKRKTAIRPEPDWLKMKTSKKTLDKSAAHERLDEKQLRSKQISKNERKTAIPPEPEWLRMKTSKKTLDKSAAHERLDEKQLMSKQNVSEALEDQPLAKKRKLMREKNTNTTTATAEKPKKMRVYVWDPSIQCEQCKRIFTSEASKNEHIKQGYCISCIDCKSNFLNLVSYLDHLKDAHAKHDVVVCQLCHQHFDEYFAHRRHEQNCKVELKKHRCEICKGTFKDHAARREHQKTCAPMKCEVCGKTFGPPRDYRVHLKQSHKMHFCERCNLTFPTGKQLEKHITTVHNSHRYDGVGVMCDVCGKKCNHMRSLAKHMTTNHGEKSKEPCKQTSQCRTCKMIFPSRLDVKRHRNKEHNKRTKHICPMCGKMMNSRHSLDDHISMHTGDLRFACQICGERFVQRSQYKRHVVRHIGIKYPCSLCGHTYESPEYLRNHVKRYHKGYRLIMDNFAYPTTNTKITSKLHIDDFDFNSYVAENANYNIKIVPISATNDNALSTATTATAKTSTDPVQMEKQEQSLATSVEQCQTTDSQQIQALDSEQFQASDSQPIQALISQLQTSSSEDNTYILVGANDLIQAQQATESDAYSQF